MPAGSINQGKINATKGYISNLLKQIEPGIQITNENIDSVIQQQMEKRNITPTFNPSDTNLTQFDQLTALIKQLNQEKLEQKKIGGKKHKSKKYRKSRKQRKTKTKRRLRRSYKYK